MTLNRVAVAVILAATVTVGSVIVAVVLRDDGANRRSKPASAKPGSPSARSAVPPTQVSKPSSASSASTTAGPPADNDLAAVRGHTIVVDAGHNGANGRHAAEISRPIFIGTQNRACDTTGTQTNDGYPEFAHNLDVALRLRDLLAVGGANVVMVCASNDGWGPCIDERAYIGNRAHAEVGISIHADGGPAGGRGFHVNIPANIPGYTDDIYGASKRLGLDLRDAFRATGMPTSTYLGANGMVERRDFGGLNLSNVPKVLFETGNMRNATDAVLLKDPAFRQREAQTLAAGFAAYFAGG